MAKKFLFIVGSIILPLFVLMILNAGVIWNIKNQIGVGIVTTDYLFTNRGNDHSVAILIGIATIFVIYFAFLQVAYSLRHIPHWYVNDYVFKHEYTYGFIAYFVTLLFVIAYFGLLYQLRNINQLFILLSIPFSILITIIYFSLFIHGLTVVGMIKRILDRFNFKSINKLENKIAKENKRYSEFINNNKMPYKIKNSDSYDFIFNRYGWIESSKEGILQSINTNKLIKTLEPIAGEIDTVEVCVSIGGLFPQMHKILFRIIPHKNQSRNNANIIDSFISAHKKKLEDCFVFDKKIYKAHSKVFHDALRTYEHIAEESPRDLEEIIKNMRRFFHDRRWYDQ